MSRQSQSEEEFLEPRQPAIKLTVSLFDYTAGMNLTLKLRKVGRSVGVILPRKVPTHLKIKVGDFVLITEEPDGGLRLSPKTAAVARQTLIGQNVVARNQHTLRDLAK